MNLHRSSLVVLVAAALTMLTGAAIADETYTLRLATVAPDGSPLANGLKRFTGDVESFTAGHVRAKWYFNGVAGDEMEELRRVGRDQLDGAASGQMFCNQVMPSMRVTRLPGLFQSRDEAQDVINRLSTTLQKEAHEHGYVLLTSVGLGPDMVLSRTPVRTMEELRRIRLWRWDLDDEGVATSRYMGMHAVPMSLTDAGPAYDAGKVDGFVAIPLAAVSFQWSARAHYLTDLRTSYIWGCFVVTEKSFNRLPANYQQAVRAAAARAGEVFEEIGKRNDEQLLGTLFAKQGAASVPVTGSFRAEFMAAARDARDKLAGKSVPRELVDRVMQMLADYRLEHGSKRAD